MKIYMIDDDSDLVMATSAILTFNGYDFDSADSAVAGLERLDEVKPDLVILDVMMEDQVAGFRVVNAMRDFTNNPGAKKWQNVPILMMTSIQQFTRTRYEQDAGTDLLPVDAFVEKPLKPRALLDMVKKLLA